MTITKPVSRKYIQSFDKRKKIKISWLFPFLLFASIVTFQCDQMKHYFLYLNMLAQSLVINTVVAPASHTYAL